MKKLWLTIALVPMIGCEGREANAGNRGSDRLAVEEFCRKIGVELDPDLAINVQEGDDGKRVLSVGEFVFGRDSEGRITDFADMAAMTRDESGSQLKSVEECEPRIFSTLRAAGITEELSVVKRTTQSTAGGRSRDVVAFFRLEIPTMNGYATRGWGNFAEVMISRVSGKPVEFHSDTGWSYEVVSRPITSELAANRAREALALNRLSNSGHPAIVGPLYFRGNSSLGARAYADYDSLKIVPLSYLISIESNSVIISAKDGKLLGGASKK